MADLHLIFLYYKQKIKPILFSVFIHFVILFYLKTFLSVN